MIFQKYSKLYSVSFETSTLVIFVNNCQQILPLFNHPSMIPPPDFPVITLFFHDKLVSEIHIKLDMVGLTHSSRLLDELLALSVFLAL